MEENFEVGEVNKLTLCCEQFWGQRITEQEPTCKKPSPVSFVMEMCRTLRGATKTARDADSDDYKQRYRDAAETCLNATLRHYYMIKLGIANKLAYLCGKETIGFILKS